MGKDSNDSDENNNFIKYFSEHFEFVSERRYWVDFNRIHDVGSDEEVEASACREFKPKESVVQTYRFSGYEIELHIIEGLEAKVAGITIRGKGEIKIKGRFREEDKIIKKIENEDRLRIVNQRYRTDDVIQISVLDGISGFEDKQKLHELLEGINNDSVTSYLHKSTYYCLADKVYRINQKWAKKGRGGICTFQQTIIRENGSADVVFIGDSPIWIIRELNSTMLIKDYSDQFHNQFGYINEFAGVEQYKPFDEDMPKYTILIGGSDGILDLFGMVYGATYYNGIGRGFEKPDITTSINQFIQEYIGSELDKIVNEMTPEEIEEERRMREYEAQQQLGEDNREDKFQIDDKNERNEADLGLITYKLMHPIKLLEYILQKALPVLKEKERHDDITLWFYVPEIKGIVIVIKPT
ncbi:MAG: hypothetical protein ABIG89_00720 [Candidatus Woesearchaeota archaeon]